MGSAGGGCVFFWVAVMPSKSPPEPIKTYQNLSEPIKEFKEFKEFREFKELKDLALSP